MRVLFLLIIPILCMADYVEYQRNGKIYWIRDTEKNASFKPSEDNAGYLRAKQSGEAKRREMRSSDYYLNPQNQKKIKLKSLLKERDLNIKELNEYLRLIR